MQIKKSRAYYQYMIDQLDKTVSYYSTEEVGQTVYDLLDDGEYDEALRACEMGLEQHSDDEYLEIVKAKVLSMLKRDAAARSLLEGNPDEWSPFGIGIHFTLDIRSQGSEKALTTLLSHFEKGELVAQEFVDIIDEQFDNLDRQLTAQFLKKASEVIQSKPASADANNAEALGRIGALLMDCNCHREAITVLEHAIDVDAYDVYSWQDLSRCQFELQMYDECLQSCDMGLAIDPTNPLFNFARGFILCDRHQYEEGLHNLEQVREYHEGRLKHEEVHLDRSEVEQQINLMFELLGTAYLALDQTDKAQECYTNLTNRLPNYAEAHYRLSMILSGKGDLLPSLEAIEKAMQLAPANETYLAYAVTIYTCLHQYKKAIKGIDQLLSVNPEKKTYLLAKAELSLTIKDYEGADKAYRSLLMLRPRDATSRTMLRSYFEAIGDEEALKMLK